MGAKRPFWHFSKLPAGFIPHPLYQTINSSEEQEGDGDMDMLTLTDNNERPTLTHTLSLSHPVVIVYHTTTPTHKTTPQCHGSAVQPPMRNNSETVESRKWEGYEAVSTAEMLEWDLEQSAAGCVLKVILKVGQGEHKEGNLSSARESGHIRKTLHLAALSSLSVTFGAGCKNAKKLKVWGEKIPNM